MQLTALVIGLIKKVTLELRLEGGEAVNHTATEGRMLQAEGAGKPAP